MSLIKQLGRFDAPAIKPNTKRAVQLVEDSPASLSSNTQIVPIQTRAEQDLLSPASAIYGKASIVHLQTTNTSTEPKNPFNLKEISFKEFSPTPTPIPQLTSLPIQLSQFTTKVNGLIDQAYQTKRYPETGVSQVASHLWGARDTKNPDRTFLFDRSLPGTEDFIHAWNQTTGEFISWTEDRQTHQLTEGSIQVAFIRHFVPDINKDKPVGPAISVIFKDSEGVYACSERTYQATIHRGADKGTIVTYRFVKDQGANQGQSHILTVTPPKKAL